MIVCLCKGLNDKQLRAAIRDGARTVRDLRGTCGAGSVCGRCVCDLRDLLHVEHTGHDEPPAKLLSK